MKQGKVTRYTTNDGLLSDSIFQLLEDGDGRIWISGATGISSVDRKELDAMAEGRPGPLAVFPYGAAEGLEYSQMNGGIQPAGARTLSGELWFHSVKGVVRVDPKQIRPSTLSPALIEAMLVGTPCVATAVGGIPSIMRDRVDGLLYQDRDPFALAGAMRRLIADPDFAASLAASGSAAAHRRHDPANVASQLVAVYADVIARASKAT